MSLEPPTEERFLRVFLQNEDALRAYARALLPTWEAVDEAMQEASVIMWRKLGQLQDESEFLPWAKVIVRFEALKARRTAARDRLCFSEDVFELLADGHAAPAEEDLGQERAALAECLGKLDESQRELVLMPYRGHGTVLAVASDKGRSANSLYKKIGRLREKLMQCIDGELAANAMKGGAA